MITVESWFNRNRQEQVFTIRIPDADVIELDFDIQERLLLENAQKKDASVFMALRALTMVVGKIERRREFISGRKEKCSKKN